MFVSVDEARLDNHLEKPCANCASAKELPSSRWAAAIGVSSAYLSALEHGQKGRPSFDFLQRSRDIFISSGMKQRHCFFSRSNLIRKWWLIQLGFRQPIRPLQIFFRGALALWNQA